MDNYTAKTSLIKRFLSFLYSQSPFFLNRKLKKSVTAYYKMLSIQLKITLNGQKSFVKMKIFWSVNADVHLKWRAMMTACMDRKYKLKIQYKRLYILIMAKFFSHSVTSVIIEIFTSQMSFMKCKNC